MAPTAPFRISSDREVEEFVEKVEKYEYFEEIVAPMYFKALDLFCETIKQEKFTPNEIERVVWRFLKRWGNIQGEKPSFERLADQISKITDELTRTNALDQELVDFNFSTSGKTIRDAYQKLTDVKRIGATGASKILHLFNPKLFVMWDKPIRKTHNFSEERANEYEYLEFLKKMKGWGIKLQGSPKISRLEEETSKHLVKLIDEYNWSKEKGLN